MAGLLGQFLRFLAARGWVASLALGVSSALSQVPAAGTDIDGARLAEAFDQLMLRASTADRAVGTFKASGRDILVGRHRVRVTPRHHASNPPGSGLHIVALRFDVEIDGQAQPALTHEAVGIESTADEAKRRAMADWYGSFGRLLLRELGGGRPTLRMGDLAVYASDLGLRNGSQALANDPTFSAERLLQLLRPVLPAATVKLQALHVNVTMEPGGGVKTQLVVNGQVSEAGTKLLAAQRWPAPGRTPTGPWYMAHRAFLLAPAVAKQAFFDEQGLADAFQRVMRSWARDPQIPIAYAVDGRDLVVEGRRVRVTPTLERLQPGGGGGQAYAEIRFEVAVDGRAQPRLTRVMQTVNPDAAMAQAQVLANWYAAVGQTVLAAASARKPDITVGSLAVYPGFVSMYPAAPTPVSTGLCTAARDGGDRGEVAGARRHPARGAPESDRAAVRPGAGRGPHQRRGLDRGLRTAGRAVVAEDCRRVHAVAHVHAAVVSPGRRSAVALPLPVRD